MIRAINGLNILFGHSFQLEGTYWPAWYRFGFGSDWYLHQTASNNFWFNNRVVPELFRIVNLLPLLITSKDDLPPRLGSWIEDGILLIIVESFIFFDSLMIVLETIKKLLLFSNLIYSVTCNTTSLTLTLTPFPW